MILTISLILVMGLIWRTEFKSLHTGYDEILIDVGNTDGFFIPEFDQIRNIVICAENSKVTETDITHIDIEIRVFDESCTDLLYLLQAYDQSVHINGFTSTESTSFEGLPMVLEKGQKYYFDYTATDDNGDLIPEELSFLLYGDSKSTNYLSAIYIFLLTLSLLYLIWNVNLSYKVFVVIWTLLMLTSLFFMPVTLSNDSNEKVYLADCYKQSNEILGFETADSENNTYIKEFGIRNMGFVSYSVPVYRFWMDSKYGNSISDNKTSNLFKNHNHTFNILQIPAVFLVSVARRMHLSYRLVLLSGWFINAFIAASIAFVALRSVKSDSIRTLLAIVLLLPSTMTGFYSYSCKGIVLSLCMLVLCLIVNHTITRKKISSKQITSVGAITLGILFLAINMDYSLIMEKGTPVFLSFIGRFDDLVYSSVINYVFYNEYFIIPVYLLLIVIVYGIIVSIRRQNVDIDSKCDYYMLTSCSVLAITIWMYHLMSL